MRSFKFFVIFLPFFAFANGFNEYYAQIFSEKMKQERFDECLEVVEYWEKMSPEIGGKALAMKAAIYFSKGDLQRLSTNSASVDFRVLLSQFSIS